MKSIGIILIIVGISLMVFTGANFFTKETVMDLGVVEITRNKPNYITWSPIAGIVVIGIGIIALVLSRKK
jgi:uncharacterized membrane protein YidH (DUF202 family)